MKLIIIEMIYLKKISKICLFFYLFKIQTSEKLTNLSNYFFYS